MKGLYGKLANVLLLLTTSMAREEARLHWEMIHSPTDGYRSIRHRSQKKLRKMARQRGFR